MVNKGTIIIDLAQKYRCELDIYIDRFKKDNWKAIPHLIARITTSIVPDMMKDVAKIRQLTGHEKKQIIEDTVIYIIDEIHKQLESIEQFKLVTLY